jgi:hypothetical protein
MLSSFEPPQEEALHNAAQRAASLRSMFRGPRSAGLTATTMELTPATPDAGAPDLGTPETVTGGDQSGLAPEPGPARPAGSAVAVPRTEVLAFPAGRYLLVALLVAALVSGVTLTWLQIGQRGSSADRTSAATVPTGPVNAAPPPPLATTQSPTASANPASPAATQPPAKPASPANPPPRDNRDLAAGAKMTSSGHKDVYVESNANDGDVYSYWESTNNAFPVWLQVDLGASARVQRIGLAVPPSPLWLKRTQTLSVQGSTDGSSFRTVLAPAGYSFDPVNANQVTIRFNAADVRYLRLTFTANTSWPAGQISTFSVYAS